MNACLFTARWTILLAVPTAILLACFGSIGLALAAVVFMAWDVTR